MKKNTTRFPCSYCDKTFSQNNLKTHERIHTGDKPFSCSHCNYNSSDLGSLRRHERIHSGAKPFKCSKCDMNFTQLADKKKHEKTHKASSH